MKTRFFSTKQLQIPCNSITIPLCGQCGLYKKCKSPRMAPTGQGRRKILVVAEAPGRLEDEKGTQLIGKAGQYLRQTLERFGVSLDRDCWKTNAIICRPPNNKLPSNPMLKINACRPNLLKTIKEKNPHVIILLGSVARKSLLPILWKRDIGDTTAWDGWRIPSQILNAWVCPTFHPSSMFYQPGPTQELKFRQDIEQALKLKGKPWKRSEDIPNYPSKVECIFRPSQAAKAIRCLMKRALLKDNPIAIDYETTCLKPEYEGAEIVSCSMSTGSHAIAYPWAGEAIGATSDVWKSRLRKIASNMKFEDRWTRYFLQHSVKNWYWDTMLAAHVLDNRKKITSVKFQAFVLLGVKAWDTNVEEYLSAGTDKHLNRIRELDLQDLLLYNGIDSLIEWLVAEKQIQMMKEQYDISTHNT